jgi:hypothetical protein
MKNKLTASMPRHFPEEMAEAKRVLGIVFAFWTPQIYPIFGGVIRAT